MTGDIPLVITKPRPPPTPCTCSETNLVVSPVLRDYNEHVLSATEMGCTLATAVDETEKTAIRDFLINNPYDGPQGQNPILLIALRRLADGQLSAQGVGPLANNPIVGGPEGPWMWDDECTPYEFNAFENGGRGFEPNNGQLVGIGLNERTGGVLYEDPFPNLIGDIIDTADTGYPALLECCV